MVVYELTDTICLQIVFGGMHGKHAGIFLKKILFSRRKNPFLADFTTGDFQIPSKIRGGGSGGGKLPPTTFFLMKGNIYE